MSVLFANEEISVYENKDGRTRVYDKRTKKVTSYPRSILEQQLDRPLKPNEQAHHKNENPMDNSPSNLEIALLGEHQKYHSTKYFNKLAKCTWCGKEFEWSADKQRRHYSGPFCSRHCSGAYGAYIQNVRDDTNASRRKLSADDIRYIRSNYIPNDPEFGSRELARKFGVAYSTMDYIVRNKTYKEIDL